MNVGDMNVADDDTITTQGDADIQMAMDNLGPFNNVIGSTHREEFPNAAHEWGAGETFMGKFDLDDFADQRKKNLYYPFASREEWEMAAFLLRSGMSMALIDDFLNLQTVSNPLFSLEICYLFVCMVDSRSPPLISNSKGLERPSRNASCWTIMEV